MCGGVEVRERGRERERDRETDRQTDRQTDRINTRTINIYREKIYSFRPLPLMKGCGWMTYHLTVPTIIMPMSKKTKKLTTMCLTR